jgi:hypothetical protein
MRFFITKQFSIRRPRLASFRESLNIATQILLMSVALANGLDPETVKLICTLATQTNIGANHGESY